jgi:hypothetical protein
MLPFIYLNIDEVVDKVPKQPTTLTNTHKHKHQSSNKRLLMTVGSGGGVAAHYGLLPRALDRGGGCPGVCVERVEVTGLTLYHPHVASDGGVHFSQLGTKSLNLMLSSQQMSAQLHRHILVVYHLHLGNILFHPVSLELILLPVRWEVVD